MMQDVKIRIVFAFMAMGTVLIFPIWNKLTFHLGSLDGFKSSNISMKSTTCPFTYQWSKFNISSKLPQNCVEQNKYDQFMFYTFNKLHMYRKIHPTRTRFPFLSNYKNPCWYENIPKRNKLYDSSAWNTNWPSTVQMRCVQREQLKMNKIYKAGGYTHRLRCFPYVLIIGMFKAGTTDLYTKLVQHRKVVQPCVKEPIGLIDKGSFTSFEKYLDLYDYFSWKARQSNDLVTVDATTGYFMDYNLNNVKYLDCDQKSSAPCATMAQHIQNLFPQVKVIFLLRNPTDWFESCINHFNRLFNPFNSAYIHNVVVNGIKGFKSCLEHNSSNLYTCVFRKNRLPCSIENSIYYVTTKHWKQIMGNRLMVINADEYYRKSQYVMNKTLQFLKLPPYTSAESKKIFSLKVQNKAAHGKKVFLQPRTKTLLMEFLKPYNKQLSLYLNDKSFLFED